MSTPPPRVFISATSGDLRSVRQIVKEALLTIGCHPVEQTNFEPDWRSVEGMLRARIEGCQAMIHIAGLRYGAEPDPGTLPPGSPRRSYTQMEYYLGCRLHEQRGDEGFRVYTFVCALDFPYDTGAESEPEEKSGLQLVHRAALIDSPRLYERPGTPDDLQTRVLALQEQVLAIRQEQAGVKREVAAVRSFGVKALAAVLVALALVGAGLRQIRETQTEIAAAHKMDVPFLRARLTEASERTLQDELAVAALEERSAKRQRLAEAAEAAHQARIVRIADLVDRLVELTGASNASPVLVEMTRILEDEGVDASLLYVDGQRDQVLAEVRAAREAERQRTRGKLQPLLQSAALQESKGRLTEARAAYRELLDLEPDWPEALERFAYFLYVQSIQAQSYGTLATALADAEETHRLAGHWIELDPTDAVARRLLSVSLTQLGDLAAARGDLAGALNFFTEALAIAKDLAASDPANADWQRDLSVSLHQLGDLAVSRRDLTGALGYFTEGLSIAKDLAASDPTNTEWQRDFSQSLERLGNLALARDDLQGALGYFTEVQAIRERLSANDPTNVVWQCDLSMSLEKLGDLAAARGDLPGALGYFTDCFIIREDLAASDPTNTAWQRDLSVSWERLGDLAVALGDLPGALGYFTGGLAIRERLAGSAPKNASWQREFLYSLLRCAQVKMKQEQWREALPLTERALAVSEKLAASDPSNVMWQEDVQFSRRFVAGVRGKLGE